MLCCREGAEVGRAEGHRLEPGKALGQGGWYLGHGRWSTLHAAEVGVTAVRRLDPRVLAARALRIAGPEHLCMMQSKTASDEVRVRYQLPF